MSEFSDAYAAGQANEPATIEVEGIPHILVPQGCTLESMEKFMEAPRRIIAQPQFLDITGFADYAEEFQEEGSRIFVDDEKRTFFIMFDAPAKGKPAWADHTASYPVRLSPEWNRFKAQDGKRMEPLELAEFIEDNLEYFVGPVTGAELLTMAQDLKVNIRGKINNSGTTQKGVTTLLIENNSEVSGGPKKVEFPAEVELSLRIFKNHTTFKVRSRLRYRFTEEGIKFHFALYDTEQTEEDAFNLVIDEVREATGLKTVRGSYYGPSPKAR